MPLKKLRSHFHIRGTSAAPIEVTIDGETIDIPDGAEVEIDIKLASGGRQTAATPSGATDRPPTMPAAPVAPR